MRKSGSSAQVFCHDVVVHDKTLADIENIFRFDGEPERLVEADRPRILPVHPEFENGRSRLAEAGKQKFERSFSGSAALGLGQHVAFVEEADLSVVDWSRSNKANGFVFAMNPVVADAFGDVFFHGFQAVDRLKHVFGLLGMVDAPVGFRPNFRGHFADEGQFVGRDRAQLYRLGKGGHDQSYTNIAVSRIRR